jgi:hypothetical protein
VSRLGERLGTVGQARDALGLVDSAEVWEEVAAGRLQAVRDVPDAPTLWTIYRVDPRCTAPHPVLPSPACQRCREHGHT